MQKAHLYEAIFLFNRGMDEAVRGLERLRRTTQMDGETVDRTRVLFEGERADVNSLFCNVLEGSECQDAADFDKRVREWQKASLDEIKVYEDVRVVEERRRKDGEPPVVQFLTREEQKKWKEALAREQAEPARAGNVAKK